MSQIVFKIENPLSRRIFDHNDLAYLEESFNKKRSKWIIKRKDSFILKQRLRINHQ